MTQEIQWGPAIAVDGKRPGFVGDADMVLGHEKDGSPFSRPYPARHIYWTEQTNISLPADHPHYRQTGAHKGLIIPAGMMPWQGGQKPADWSGEAVMFRNGEIRHAPAGAIWKMGWDHSYGMGDIVAYSVATPQADTKPDLTARMEALVRRMNETGSLHYAKSCDPLFDEARAIVALLPEPVDPDEQYARDLIREQGWSGEREIGSEAVVVMIAKARRDALALAGEKEA